MRPAVYERARRRECARVPIVADIDHPERRTLIDDERRCRSRASCTSSATAAGSPTCSSSHGARSSARCRRSSRELRGMADRRPARSSGARSWPRGATPARAMRTSTRTTWPRGPTRSPDGLRAHARRSPGRATSCPPTSPRYRARPPRPRRDRAARTARPTSRAILAGSSGRCWTCSGAGASTADGGRRGDPDRAIADAEPPFGGPWIMRGLPRPRAPRRRAARCCERALARAHGRPPALGLAVTEGNPAIAALRGARLPPHPARRIQSTCSARATIAAPSTPAGSVP